MKKNFLAGVLLSFFFVQLLAHDPPSLDQEKQDYINSYIEIKSVYAKYINTYLDDFAVPAFRYSIKNNGPETISTLWVRVYFLDQNDSPFFDEDYLPISQYADMKYLKPNYTFRMETGKYMTVKEIDATEWSGNIKIEVLTNKLEFKQ
jgi:hypothetical protein